MAYKVFFTDVALPPGVNQPDFSKLIPFSVDTLDVAVKKACELMKRGAIVWKIDGRHGVEMTRAQVEKACASDKPKFTLGPGPIVKSTEGMTHKQHKDRNVQIPFKRPTAPKGK